ncbi:MAG: DsrE family protein [Ignavibacteria bacterium]|nr:DsrE family protein [Ignavibacteria bacterium]
MKNLSFILFASLLFIFSNAKAQNPEIKDITHKTNVTSVWEVNTDVWENGVGAGLHYPSLLNGRYIQQGLKKGDYQISVVVHLAAGYWLLNDAAYVKHTGKSKGNPNKDLVAQLIADGVSVEICGVTMENNKWTASDLLPGVMILGMGAYARIVDLQKSGYSYIRF